jgi:hypothetical protein
MGLDVYVGPLTRYYSFTWETLVQQAARQHGIQSRIDRSPDLAARTPGEAQAMVLGWRAGLEGRLGTNLSWEESAEGAYVTDKPDWDGYHALRYLALHDEFPDVRPPRRLDPKPDPSDLDHEPLERRFGEVYARQPRRGIGRFLGRRPIPPDGLRYLHLQAADMWIPPAFPTPFQTLDPVWAIERRVGSVRQLRAELEGLNERTLRADPAQLMEIRAPGQPPDGNFAELSRFGLAAFLLLVREADDRGMPMVLDG